VRRFLSDCCRHDNVPLGGISMRSTRTTPSFLRLDEGQVRVRRHATIWYIADSRTELLRVLADERTDVPERCVGRRQFNSAIRKAG
jgi:hypothetical protein